MMVDMKRVHIEEVAAHKRDMSFQVHEEHGLEDEPEDGVGQGLLQVQSLANVKYRCNMCNVLALWSKKVFIERKQR